MTYRELLGYAQKKIDNNEITVSEYMEMTKALNREVDVLDKIRAEIEQDAFKDVNGTKYIFVNRVNQIIDKYRNEVSE